jgi:hypothetical protein
LGDTGDFSDRGRLRPAALSVFADTASLSGAKEETGIDFRRLI